MWGLLVVVVLLLFIIYSFYFFIFLCVFFLSLYIYSGVLGLHPFFFARHSLIQVFCLPMEKKKSLYTLVCWDCTLFFARHSLIQVFCLLTEKKIKETNHAKTWISGHSLQRWKSWAKNSPNFSFYLSKDPHQTLPPPP